MMTAGPNAKILARKPLSPEVRLLLLCARTTPSSAQKCEIQTLLRQEQIDWPLLCDLSQQHYVFPLLWHTLRDCAGMVPEVIALQLQHWFEANAFRNLLLASELIRITNLLDAQGIPSIAIKGPVLTTAVYGNLAFRPFCDLDILVPEAYASRARDLIVSAGYSELQPNRNVRNEKPFHLVHEPKGITIELHYSLIPRRLAVPFESAIWARSEQVNLAGTTIRTLALEDLFIYLCAHGVKHRWHRLQWICDIAELVRARPDISWSQILTTAQERGLHRVVWIGVWVAYTMLGIRIPDQLERTVPPAVRMLADEIISDLFAPKNGNPPDIEVRLLELRARERFADRLVILLRTALRHCKLRKFGAPSRQPLQKALRLLRRTVAPSFVLLLAELLDLLSFALYFDGHF
jgi:hypothetical protein